jgi:hypothetical protein
MNKLRQSVSNANTGVQNLGSAGGRAVLASEAQGGLGARQGAASSFYMGSSNPMFQQTSQRFGNLNQMLVDSAARAGSYGEAGQTRMDQNAKDATLKAAAIDAANAKAARDAELQRREKGEQGYLAERRASNKSGGVEGRTNMSEQEIASTMGLPYEDWLAAGKPVDQNDARYKAALAKYKAAISTGGL